MKVLSVMVLLMMVLTIQMASSQVVYQADYEDASCGSAPYRYSTYTSTCLNGRTATRCDTRAYMNVCSNCVSNNTCFVDTSGSPINTCFGSFSGTKLSCAPIAPSQSNSYASYVEYTKVGCGTMYADQPSTYNQTKFKCANTLDSIQCLADGTGVAYTKWGAGSNCNAVEFQKNFKFGDCAEITQGSLYRKFTACVSSAANANMDPKKMFVLLVGVLMSTVMVMGTF
jgi:hypothetical protein